MALAYADGAFDLELDVASAAPLKLQLHRPRTRSGRRPFGDATVGERYEPRRPGGPLPGMLTEAVYDSWAGGAGFSRRGPRGTYDHARFVSTRGPYPMPAGALTEVTPAGGWVAGAYGVCSAEYGGALYFATAAREVYWVGTGTPIPPPTVVPPTRASGTLASTTGQQTELTFTKPSGLAAGDVLTAIFGIRSGSIQIVTAPSGWALIRSVDGGNIILYAYRKVITNAAGEPASYTWRWTFAARARGTITRWTGASITAPIDASGEASGTSTTAAVGALTASRAQTQLVMAAVQDLPGGADNRFSGWTAGANGLIERFDDGNDSDLVYGEATDTQPASGTTGGFSAALASSVPWAAIAFIVNPIDTVVPEPTPTAVPAVITTLPVGWKGEPDGMAVFNGALWIGSGGTGPGNVGIARYNGAWTTHTGTWPGAGSPRFAPHKLAVVYWVVAGVGGYQMIATDEANTGFYRVSSGGDPSVPANWTSVTVVGDVSYPIRSLAASNRTIWFAKSNGIHSVDSRGYTPNLTPHWERAYSPDNGEAAIIYEGKVIASHHEGIEAVNVADMQRVDRPEWLDPNHYLPNQSAFHGLATAYVNERGWLGVSFWNETTGMSYVGYGRPSRGDEGGPYDWHFWECEVAGRITHMRVSSPDDQPRLWIWSRDGTTPHLYWQSLPRAANAYQDYREGNTGHRYYPGGELYQSREDFGREGDPKLILRHVLVSENLDSARTLDLDAAAEGGPFLDQGTASQSPRVLLTPIVDVGRAHELQHRITFNGSADEPVILRALSSEAMLFPEQLSVRGYRVVIGDGVGLDNAAFDMRRPAAVLDALEALQDSDPIEIRDNLRREHFLGKVRGGLETGIEEDTDESGNHRGWTAYAAFQVTVLSVLSS